MKRKMGVKIGVVSAELMAGWRECPKKRVGVKMRCDREEVCRCVWKEGLRGDIEERRDGIGLIYLDQDGGGVDGRS